MLLPFLYNFTRFSGLHANGYTDLRGAFLPSPLFPSDEFLLDVCRGYVSMQRIRQRDVRLSVYDETRLLIHICKIHIITFSLSVCFVFAGLYLYLLVVKTFTGDNIKLRFCLVIGWGTYGFHKL